MVVGGSSSLQQIREQSFHILHQIRHQIQRPCISFPQIRPFHFHFHLPIHFHSSSSILTLQVSGGIRRRTIDVAAAQCGVDSENDVVPQHNIEEFPSAFTGYTLLHLSRPLISPSS
uniref:Uncharacterized protein n=1 Tax=Fagus sylvatica TaxID=28930 RepID=A0A2N9FHC3_FAGSY